MSSEERLKFDLKLKKNAYFLDLKKKLRAINFEI